MTPRLKTTLRIGAVVVIAGLLSACYGYPPRPAYTGQGYSGYNGYGQGYGHGYGYNGYGRGYRHGYGYGPAYGYSHGSRYRHRYHGY